jgi:aspartyl/asparaginyl beta-hydroxylase (cupin superfamily)
MSYMMSVILAKPRPSPTLFIFPGLKSQPVYHAADFSWTSSLEAHLDVIREEYVALKRKKKNISDYVVSGKEEHSLHHGEWNWFTYVAKGKRNTTFEADCPITSRLLNDIPGFMTDVPFAYAFFSSLQPQSAIKPHSAPCNIRLRCHFPYAYIYMVMGRDTRL